MLRQGVFTSSGPNPSGPRFSTVRFGLSDLGKVARYGFPCAYCFDELSFFQNIPLSDFSFENGKRRISSCPTCAALICNQCSFQIERFPDQQLGCKWCGNTLSPPRCSLLSREEQTSTPFTQYQVAEQNIKGILDQWFCMMSYAHRGYDISKVFWANMVNRIGWRFFVNIDTLILQQHPSQFRLLISMMMKNAFPSSQHHIAALQSYVRFSQMHADMFFIYMQCRRLLVHTHSVFLTCGIIKRNPKQNCKWVGVLRQRLLSMLCRELFLGLGIYDEASIRKSVPRRQISGDDSMQSD